MTSIVPAEALADGEAVRHAAPATCRQEWSTRAAVTGILSSVLLDGLVRPQENMIVAVTDRRLLVLDRMTRPMRLVAYDTSTAVEVRGARSKVAVTLVVADPAGPLTLEFEAGDAGHAALMIALCCAVSARSRRAATRGLRVQEKAAAKAAKWRERGRRFAKAGQPPARHWTDLG